MRFILMGLFALVLTSGAAHAGWNITQQDDGSTVWTDENGVTVPVGDAGLTVNLTDLSTAATAFVISHRAGKIKKIYAVGGADTAGTAALSIGIGTGVTPGTFTPISLTSAGSSTHISILLDSQGLIYSYTPADSNVDVSQGSVISVSTDGGSTTTSLGTITIIIE